jgi:hypothetical protein
LVLVGQRPWHLEPHWLRRKLVGLSRLLLARVHMWPTAKAVMFLLTAAQVQARLVVHSHSKLAQERPPAVDPLWLKLWTRVWRVSVAHWHSNPGLRPVDQLANLSSPQVLLLPALVDRWLPPLEMATPGLAEQWQWRLVSRVPLVLQAVLLQSRLVVVRARQTVLAALLVSPLELALVRLVVPSLLRLAQERQPAVDPLWLRLWTRVWRVSVAHWHSNPELRQVDQLANSYSRLELPPLALVDRWLPQ